VGGRGGAGMAVGVEVGGLGVGVGAGRRWRQEAGMGRRQGLTLVHFSAQQKRFLWDRGCVTGCFGPSRRCYGVLEGIQVVLCV